MSLPFEVDIVARILLRVYFFHFDLIEFVNSILMHIDIIFIGARVQKHERKKYSMSMHVL